MTASRFVVALVLVSFSLPGCTLINWGIGSSFDGKARFTKGRRNPVPPLQVASLDKGRAVELTLRDGEVVQGYFKGLEPVPDAAYAARWQESLQQLLGVVALPPLRSRVTLSLRSGKQQEAQLLGLEPGFLSVSASPSGPAQRVALDDVARLSFGSGDGLEGTTLARLAAEGRLPFLQAARIKLSHGSRPVPVESIHTAALVTPGRQWKTVGIIVGLVADAVIIAGLGSWVEDDVTPSCGPNCTSCPFVYSHDAGDFRLDAEPLGASLFAADEATDRVLLPQLAASQGSYRVRIRNQQEEIDQIDAVRLLVIEHSPGAEVLPDMTGGFHALGAPVGPFRAEARGAERLEALLAEEDGRPWVALPLGRAPGAERDVVELEFERPAGATAATLAFSARATPWGSQVFSHLLRLHGREQGAFWARMETDHQARRALREAWAREALPRVSVWTGAAWRHAGGLAHVPIVVTGRRALRLDLRGIEGATLRVRVESMPGLWAFDRVAADFSASPPLQVERLAPREARAADGRDVLAPLLGSDDSRLTLAALSGQVDLAFDAPAPAGGRARTLALEVEGHYRPLLPADGEPQTALFERLVREPGALARYVVEGAEVQTRLALAAAGHGAGR